MKVLLDSGSRREFDTGAVRDIQEGKGRCDLLPLDVVATVMLDDNFIYFVSEFRNTGKTENLVMALRSVCGLNLVFESVPHMFIEVSKHFEDGAKKYGEYNWQKGIPINCYIDSAIRHYLKWLRGDKDEPHNRAFVWNIVCCIWTINHIEQDKHELNHD